MLANFDAHARTLCILVLVLGLLASQTTAVTVTKPAAFRYPTERPTINHIDTLYVTYSTDWPAANLTYFCYLSPAKDLYDYYNAVENPLLGSGTYILRDVGQGLAIKEYPVVCHMLLTEYGHSTNNLNGAYFTMTSSAGTTATHKMTKTGGVPAATKTQAGTGTSAPSVVLGTNTAASAAGTSISSLSEGAKIGIGAGAGVIVVVVAAAVVYMLSTRRKLRRIETAHKAANAGRGWPGQAEKMSTQHAALSVEEIGVAPGPAPRYDWNRVPRGWLYESDSREVPVEMGVTSPRDPRLQGRYELGP